MGGDGGVCWLSVVVAGLSVRVNGGCWRWGGQLLAMLLLRPIGGLGLLI